MLIPVFSPIPVITSYDADAQTYFDAIVTNGGTEPTVARKAVLNTLIAGLKTDGVWDDLIWMSLLAANDHPAARLNIKNTSQIATAVNSPTFTSDRGYTGDGASAHLSTGVTGSTIVAEDSCCFIYVRTRGTTDTDVFGYRGAFGFIRSTTATATISGAWRGSAQSTLASSAADNQFIAVRRTTGLQNIVVDSTFDTNDSVTINSTSLTNSIFFLRSSSTYTNGQLSIAGWANHLDNTQTTNLRSRINDYLVSIGAR